MNRKCRIRSILMILLMCAVVMYIFAEREDNEQRVKAVPVHPSLFYDEEGFVESISRPKSAPPPDSIRGGVVPHHLVAGYMIADFFHILSSYQEVERIILLGPNHYLRGPRITTSRYSWETPFGILERDEEVIKELVDRGIAQVYEEMMPEEHSIAALIPYIKYYLPDVKLVPLIVRSDLSLMETTNLASILAQYIGDNGVMVASIDFSHYLTVEEAQEKDKVTIQAIQEGNVQQLLRMGNDHLDSPASMVTLMQAMKILGTENLTILHHSNSGFILGRNAQETTSYFTLIYY